MRITEFYSLKVLNNYLLCNKFINKLRNDRSWQGNFKHRPIG